MSLQHERETFPVRLQPVLLEVLFGRLPQFADHLVEAVHQRGDLATGFDVDLPREVALRHRGSDLCDRTDLVGEVGRELVDVVGEILPDTADLRRLHLSPQYSFHADFPRDTGDFACEGVDLMTSGYVIKRRIGRRNHYEVRMDRQVKDDLIDLTIGDVLDLLIRTSDATMDVEGE